MNITVSWALVVLLIFLALSIVVISSFPLIKGMKSQKAFEKMKNIIREIKFVLSEIGNNETRKIHIELPKALEIDAKGDYIYARSDVTLLPKKIDGIYYVPGSNAKCYETNKNVVLENRFLKVVFQKPSNFINTSSLLKYIQDKNTKNIIRFDESSVVIDEINETMYGYGSYELTVGNALPLCVFKVYVNATIPYVIYYRLFSGMDFLLIEVVPLD